MPLVGTIGPWLFLLFAGLLLIVVVLLYFLVLKPMFSAPR